VPVLFAVAVIVRLGFGRMPDAGNEDALLERTVSSSSCGIKEEGRDKRDKDMLDAKMGDLHERMT